VAGEPLFFAFWNTAVNVAIGKRRILLAKLPTFAKKHGFAKSSVKNEEKGVLIGR